jgi:hypothetical protein
VKRKTLFAALACALLVFSMLGCNALQTTNHLRSIQLNVALINGVAPSGQNGFVTLQGNGGTIQLQAIGNYSSGQTKDLTNEVTYTVAVDPNADIDDEDPAQLLLPPCKVPDCPVPSAPPYTSGTVEYSPTGLITAVEPAVCTIVNVAILPAKTPSWAYVGDYMVTASFGGFTSQPIFIPVASAVGVADPVNTSGACGPG